MSEHLVTWSLSLINILPRFKGMASCASFLGPSLRQPLCDLAYSLHADSIPLDSQVFGPRVAHHVKEPRGGCPSAVDLDDRVSTLDPLRAVHHVPPRKLAASGHVLDAELQAVSCLHGLSLNRQLAAGGGFDLHGNYLGALLRRLHLL